MDWATQQAAIRLWAATETGLVTVWADQNAPRPPYPYLLLNVIAERRVGGDEVRYTGPNVGGKLDPEINGNRIVTISCQAHSLTQAPASAGRAYTSKLGASVRKQAVIDALAAAGLAFVRAVDMASLDREVEGRWVSVNLLDLQFAAVEVLADSAIDYIERVTTTGTATTPSGATQTIGPATYGV